MLIYKIPSGYSICNVAIVSVSNQNDYRSVLRQTKIPENKIKKMPLPPPKNHTAYGTYLYFAGTDALKTFLRDYRQILTTDFQKIKIEGGMEYWTCGHEHDPRNWKWKPWQHLERLCRKRGFDDFAVREILEEHLARELECECLVLYDGIVENEPRFVFSVVLMISFLSILSIGFQSRKSLLIRCASIGFKLKTVLSCHDSFYLSLVCISSLIVSSDFVAILQMNMK